MHETFVFISKFCSVTHPDYSYACNINNVNSNSSSWGKVIQWNFFVIQKMTFSIELKFYRITFCHTATEVKEFRDLGSFLKTQ